MDGIETVAAAILAILCAAAVWFDVTTRRIPNALCLLTGVTGLAVAAASQGLPVAASCLAHGLVALAVGIALFAGRIVGGGDAKFYGAVAAWLPLGQAIGLAVSVSLSGLAGFMIWFAWRRLRGVPISRKASSDRDRFPYAIAIAAGVFFVHPDLLAAVVSP